MKDQLLCLFVLLVFGVYLSSCNSFKQPDFKRIDNVRLDKIGLKESSLSLDLHYFNPNKSKLKLKEVHGDAWLDDNFLGQFSMDSLIHIPARDSFYLPVKLKVDMGKLLKNSLAAFISNEVILKVKGVAKVGKSVVYINYPINYEGKQNIAALLK
jgi:LEA14-like dessication related protein